jgi:probable rRNA maturation factor
VIPRVDVDRAAAAWPSRAVMRTLARRVRRAARAMGCTRVELDALELRIVDDARMRALKAAHFGVAEATDVLSFPAGEPIPGHELEAEVAGSLGEIVINRDAVARQATRPGLAGWLDEATALAIHGVAHLRGHDHDRRDRARRMLTCEQRGSRAVGLPCTRPYGRGPLRSPPGPRPGAPPMAPTHVYELVDGDAPEDP